jgi:hypothetical protein
MNFKWTLAYLFLFLFSQVSFSEMDRTKYIGIDEIKSGDKAYCLTVYQGTNIEKFEMEVISIVKNAKPDIFSSGGKNTILVMGLDERFKHTGPVAGCSGSPVYIDGRLAGALAVGFSYSKDPLYGVTPIEEMLTTSDIKQILPSGGSNGSIGLNLDYSKPFSIDNVVDAYRRSFSLGGQQESLMPLITSLGANEEKFLYDFLGQNKFKVFSSSPSGAIPDLDVKLEQGSTVCIPFVSGDISINALGTVTEVDGNKVYAFGHPFIGQGAIDLPMSNGYVHTFVSTITTSFKLGQAGKITGAFRNDESTAIFGIIGEQAPLIRLGITINAYNDIPRKYNCMLAVHPKLTPMLANVAMLGAAEMKSGLPDEHLIKYKCSIDIDGYESIEYENFLCNQGFTPIAYEWLGILAAIMDNPYKKVKINSIDFQIDTEKRHSISTINKIAVSDTKLKPGQEIKVSIITEKYLGGKSSNEITLKVPDDIKDGKYKLTVCGQDYYRKFMIKSMPQRFVADSIESLIDVIKKSVSTPRKNMYVILELGSDGFSLERAELPAFPPSKMLVLDSPKRSIQPTPYGRWIEQNIATNDIIMNEISIDINVEK